jgi:hypothetical protein
MILRLVGKASVRQVEVLNSLLLNSINSENGNEGRKILLQVHLHTHWWVHIKGIASTIKDENFAKQVSKEINKRTHTNGSAWEL